MSVSVSTVVFVCFCEFACPFLMVSQSWANVDQLEIQTTKYMLLDTVLLCYILVPCLNLWGFHCLHYFLKGVPHGSMKPSYPQGVGLEIEREPDSLALGWQLSPKQQGTDVPLIPSPSLSSPPLPLSPCPVHHWSSPTVPLFLSASQLMTQLLILSLSWCCM